MTTMATSFDKAVSTEDFCFDPGNRCIEVVKLEAVLNALVEHKVESIKNNGIRSLNRHGNPRELVKRLMTFTSSPLRLVYSTDTSRQSKNIRKPADTSYSRRDRKLNKISGKYPAIYKRIFYCQCYLVRYFLAVSNVKSCFW